MAPAKSKTKNRRSVKGRNLTTTTTTRTSKTARSTTTASNGRQRNYATKGGDVDTLKNHGNSGAAPTLSSGKEYKEEVLGKRVAVRFILGHDDDEEDCVMGEAFFSGFIQRMMTTILEDNTLDVQHLVLFDDGDERWLYLGEQEDLGNLEWLQGEHKNTFAQEYVTDTPPQDLVVAADAAAEKAAEEFSRSRKVRTRAKPAEKESSAKPAEKRTSNLSSTTKTPTDSKKRKSQSLSASKTTTEEHKTSSASGVTLREMSTASDKPSSTSEKESPLPTTAETTTIATTAAPTNILVETLPSPPPVPQTSTDNKNKKRKTAKFAETNGLSENRLDKSKEAQESDEENHKNAEQTPFAKDSLIGNTKHKETVVGCCDV